MRAALLIFVVACTPPAPVDHAVDHAVDQAVEAPPTAAPTAAPVAPKQSIVIARRPITVGLISVEDERRTTHLEMSSSGVIVEIDRQEQRRKRSEVLAVVGGVVRKLSVAYLIHRVVQRRDGALENSRQAIVEGREYIVERTAGGVRVTGPRGAFVNDQEKAFVAEDFDGIGRPSGLDAFPPRPMVVGERVPELEAGLRRDLFKKKSRTSDIEVRLVELKGDAAVFAGKFVVSDERAEVHSQYKAVFEVDVRTGRPLRASFTSPVVITTDEATGAGTVNMVSEWTYPATPIKGSAGP